MPDASTGLTVAQLVGQLERTDPESVVLLGNAPGPLAHLTETDSGVILDRCTHGTCCSSREGAPLPVPALPPGIFGRVELPGFRSCTGWMTEGTLAGQPVMVFSNRDGEVLGEYVMGPASRFVRLQVAGTVAVAEPLRAITAGYDDDDPYDREGDDDDQPF